MPDEITNITQTSYGKISETPIIEEMQRSYLDYAMSVIVSRALPDVRDGLKPVHRRILYAMHKLGLSFAARFSKSAKVVGEVLGKYHPHGDMPVYDALARMAQDFSMRYTLIAGQGNFGSIDGDPPAAMRYTEVKMAKISQEIMRDIEKETVPFIDNFDGSLQEPTLLPAAIPNLLLMGADGIAVGMATKIPPHNLGEVIDALVFMIERSAQDPNENNKSKNVPSEAEPITTDQLMNFIKGPDFPTAATIYDIEEVKKVYATGRGKIIMRAKATIEETPAGKPAIIVTEIPYQVNKATMIGKIAQLVKDKKVTEISDLRDESDRRGIRVVMELKRGSIPKKVLNRLYKFTQLQTTFPANMVALVDGTPKTLSLKEILEEFLKHRQHIVRLRSEFELKQAKAREHILEGLKIAVDNIDEVISTIRRATDVEDAKTKLMSRFKLSDIQAQAILDMQLKRLAALERQKIEEELAMIRETIAYLTDLLAHPVKILDVIKGELIHTKQTFADERKTKVIKGKVGEFSDEDLIPNDETLITISKTGYIKRVAKGTFKVQRRGGKGVIGMETKDEDDIKYILPAETHDIVMFFTNRGRVFEIRCWDIGETSRKAKGQAIINLINIEQGELIQSVLTVTPEQFANSAKNAIMLATKRGVVKKTSFAKYKNIKTSGLIAINLDSGDELVWAEETEPHEEILLVTHNGKVIKFSAREVRETGRATRGVTGIHLTKDDYVVAMEVVPTRQIPDDKRKKYFQDVLVVTEKGLGKRTDIDGFRGQHRGGKGIKIANLTTKTGLVAQSLLVTEVDEQLIISSKKGQIIKLPIKNIPQLSRDTQGVILMRFTDKGDSVATATAV
ncbi:DNA gyrase subunit A [Candidatus Roizmanbacteria bacterium]|nr:DNA gyrase subunit A [Candidatus Roizmanbacteria bacterium]